MTRTRCFVSLAVVALTLPSAAVALPTPPPRATVSAGAARIAAALGSYCWSAAGKATCVDMIPPERRSDIPTLTVRRGALVRIALRFRAAAWSVARVGRTKATALPPGRSAAIRAQSAGLFVVSVTKSAPGSASYLFRVSVR